MWQEQDLFLSFPCLLSSSCLIHLNVPVLTNLISPFLKKMFYLKNEVNTTVEAWVITLLFLIFIHPILSILLKKQKCFSPAIHLTPDSVYILMILSPFVPLSAFHREPSLVLCDDLEGWDGGRGRSSRGKGCIYNYGQFVLLYGRTNTTL